MSVDSIGKYRNFFWYVRYIIVGIRYVSVLVYLKILDIGSVFRYTDPRLV